MRTDSIDQLFACGARQSGLAPFDVREERTSGQGLPQNHPEGIDVGPPINRTVPQLLGRQIAQLLRQECGPRRAIGTDRAARGKIEQLHPALVAEPHPGWLQLAVNQAQPLELVQDAQRAADCADDV